MNPPLMLNLVRMPAGDVNHVQTGTYDTLCGDRIGPGQTFLVGHRNNRLCGHCANTLKEAMYP